MSDLDGHPKGVNMNSDFFILPICLKTVFFLLDFYHRLKGLQKVIKPVFFLLDFYHRLKGMQSMIKTVFFFPDFYHRLKGLQKVIKPVFFLSYFQNLKGKKQALQGSNL